MLALLLLSAARSATIAVTPDGARVATVNPDSNSVSILDTASRTKIAEVAVCATPQTLSIDANRLFVVCRDGRLNEVDLESMRVTRAAAAGVEPFAVVASGGRVYISLFGESRVLVFDASLSPIGSIATEEFPRGLAFDDGKLYVTHFRSGKLSVIDTATNLVSRVISTGSDSNVSQSVLVSGNRAWLPQTRSNATNPALLFDSTAFPIVTVIDLVTGQNLPKDRIAIDIADRPSNTPIDVAITSGGLIAVVNAGSEDVSLIDLATRRAVAHLEVGINPRGIALSPDERFAYVNNTLSGTVSVIDMTSRSVAATIASTKIPLEPAILNGKILFNSSNRTTLAKDRWISCATCHFDGGTDGRTWFFRDGPRNTPPLFGVGETLPMHWSGDLDELQDVENTIRNIQAGSGLAPGAGNCDPACDQAPPNTGRSKDLDDLAAFMRSLRAASRPPVSSDAAVRGKALFVDTGCASCHPPPLFTDRQKHDVGTASVLERKGSAFDTPSLRGIAFSAPYMHDGSQATLLDVVRNHGNAESLSDPQKSDLAEYLRTIDFAPPRRRAALR